MRFLATALVCVPALLAAELQPQTAAAFERYVGLSESRLDTPGAPLLWLDRLPEPHRQELFTQLRRGQIVIEPIETRDQNGKPVAVPEGLIHHWIGVVFIAGATLKQTLALVQDYNRHEEIYKPEVIRSKLLRSNGNEYEVFLRLYKKRVIAVVLNTVHQVTYFPLDAARAHSRSHATRIAEVEHVDQPDGPEKPLGHDHGFLWRLNSYWRYHQRDGGLYLECESISLTRNIPTGLGWMIGPIVKTLPRQAVFHTLECTRHALGGGSLSELSHSH